ncbi:DUF5067 domain-containing protein [Eggerthella timonensis]|uniref:DUF5067 domain-containing protein n=1 Tax=Eggerthella timonensis TaxID=1871008 RepID=UPI0015E15304|nr:DUF5067 domain-containing protein [Eggerthella timonensis]
MARERAMTRRSFAALALASAIAAPAALSGCAAGGAGPEFDVRVERAWTTGGRDGKRMLVLDLVVKNNGAESVPADYAGYSCATASQGGAALAQGYLSSEVPGALPTMGGNLAPGEEGRGQVAFELRGDGPAEVVVAPATVDGKSTVELYRETLNLSRIEKVESEAGFDLEVGGATVADDGEGKDLVVVDFTFTNNADEARSFGSAADVQLYQNDVGLKQGHLPYRHPSYDEKRDGNRTAKVKKGASVEVQAVWELLDAASPVELKVVDWESYDQRTVLEKTIELAGSAKAPAADAGAKA